ncbi:MAG: FliM/FliN family flagellar motor switch protein [Planctomycetota bacterium]|nr:FliM/FliN family flagellar motor switch protein [Planctomycetota bacterium]
MLDQTDIDAVLESAQTAVDELADRADSLLGAPSQSDATGGSRAETASVPTGGGGADTVSMPTGGIERILRLRVPVVVRLAARFMPLSEVLKLAPGSIIEFERNVNSELDLLVNNCQIGSGEAVKVGEHFGIRISFVGDVRKRIESLGGS